MNEMTISDKIKLGQNTRENQSIWWQKMPKRGGRDGKDPLGWEGRKGKRGAKGSILYGWWRGGKHGFGKEKSRGNV